MKPQNLSSSLCPEMECTKTSNHKTKKPLNILLSRDWVQREKNHETFRRLAVQRWSARNHEIMKPRNLSTSRCPVMEFMKTMKPQNHATKKPVNISLFRYGVHGEKNNETTKTWNHEPYRHLTVQCPDMDCMKLWNISLNRGGVHGKISHETKKTVDILLP